MSRARYFISLIGILLALAVFKTEIYSAPLAPPRAEMNKVEVKQTDTSLQVIITVNQEVNFKNFILTPPPKIVVDLYDTEHNWPTKDLEVNIAPIIRIRSAQFRERPVYISRVVLDLTKKSTYKITSKEGKIEIEIPLAKEKRLAPEVTIEEPTTTTTPTNTATVPVEPQPETTPETTLTSGLMSMDFEKADIRDVLTSLALKKNINMIIEDDVRGELSVNLHEVTFEEALNTILRIKNLALEEISPQVLRITAKEKSGLTTNFFQLKYAKAEEVAILIGDLISNRGKFQIDKRTNGLFITETTENMSKIMEAVQKIDIRVYSVEIKAEIVEVDTSAMRELGVNWNVVSAPPLSSDRINVDVTSNLGEVNKSYTRMDVNIGTLVNISDLRATISLLASKGKSRLLSSPRITTLDNQEAKIIIGDKVPYEKKTISSSAAGETATETTVEFLDIGIKLLVTPTININKQVTMKIRPEVSTYTPSTLAPIVHTREAETTVIMNDGQTIVIGGLIREEERDLTDSVPFIGEIPILGTFFKYSTKKKENTELLIFITPRILE